MNAIRSSLSKSFFIGLLLVLCLGAAPAVLGDAPGQAARRVPPALIDPATGEKIIEIPADWKTYYPFSERFAEVKLAADDDHLMDLRTTGFLTDGLADTAAGGQRTFREPDLRSFPAELVRRPFEFVPRDYFIVQAGSPAQQIQLRNRLEAAGVPILDYLPRLAYLVKLDAASLRSLTQAPPVFWLGYFHPAFRVDPQLDYIYEADYQHVVKMTAQFDGDYYPDLDSLVAALRNVDLDILDFGQTDRGWLMRLEGPVAESRRLAVLPGCLWVERFVDRQLHNNIARTSVNTITGRGATNGPIMDVEDVWARGIRGEGQIASAADTGLSTGVLTTLHWDFGQSGVGTNPLRVIKGYALGRATWDDDQAAPMNGGHGTHTSGSIVGNGIRSGSTPDTNTFPTTCYAGAAPKAQFVFQSVMRSNGDLGGLPTDLTTLFQPPYTDGARVHSNSWGAPNDGLYDADSQNVDKFTWTNKDMVITFSAGNDGEDGTFWNGTTCASTGQPIDGVVDTDSIGTPGTAKNCITVGASESYRPNFVYQLSAGGTCNPAGTFNQRAWGWGWCYTVDPILNDYMCNNANGLAAFSSRGPTDDTRIKPDLVAPGAAITSTRTIVHQGYEAWGECEIPAGYQTYYVNMAGTSMANPLTAGCATLVRQYYVDGWHANASAVTNGSAVPANGFNPSSALVKATLINGAWDMNPGQYGTGATKEIPPGWDSPHDLPNNAEGYGRVDLEHSLFPGSGWGDNANRIMAVYDVSPGLILNGYTDYTFTVSGNANPFIATLVWTDPYGAIPAAKELVNDLDLRVTGPGPTVYYPNRLNYTGGTADRLNNVEQVKVTSPASGIWTIRVTGYAVPGNGVSGSTTQPYALVISGISPPCGTAAPTGVAAAPYGDNAIQVTWNSVAGATEYRVRRATVTGGPYTQIGTATGLAYIDSNVTNGVTYYYVVRAYAGCESGNSTEASATAFVTCNLPPTFAGLTSATNAGTANCGINLAWSAATTQCGGTITYAVFRDTLAGFAPAVSNRIAVGLTGTSFADANGLVPGTTYYYVARATDSGNGVEDTNSVKKSAAPIGPLVLTTYYGPQNFDSYADGDLAGWTLIGTGDWVGVRTCSPANSGTKIYRCGATTCAGSYANKHNAIMARPPAVSFPASATTPRLQFYHRYSWSSGDGGYLRISTNGTNFTDVTAAAILAGPYNGTANGHACWTGNNNSSFTLTQVDLDAACNLIVGNTGGAAGKTVYIGFTEYTGNSGTNLGWYIDDVQITAYIPSACSNTPGDVQFLTSTSTNQAVKLEWVNPTGNFGGTTRVCRKTGDFPSGPNDGDLVTDVTGSAGAYSTYSDQTGLSNGTVYYYAVYAQAPGTPGAYADGKIVNGRPFITTGRVKWAFAAGASLLAPPAVRPGGVGTGAVYAVANDRLFHATDPGATGGGWPETAPFAWVPLPMNAPAQSRPGIVYLPTYPPIPASPRMAFLASQDGYVYAADADSGGASPLWTSGIRLGETVQAGVAGAFREFDGTLGYDIVFAASRNATSANKVYGLNPATGAVLWTFDNGGVADPAQAMGIICGKPAVDYTNRRLYFASRRHGGGSANTVWCLTFTQASATRLWAVNVGDVDGAPTLSNGRVYVGTNAGWVYALSADTGATLCSSLLEASAVKSFVFPEYIGPGNLWRVYCSTAGKVWVLTDNGGTSFGGTTTPVTTISSPSPPLRLYGNNALLVGAGDGKLYQIDVTSPGSTPLNVTLGLAGETVGGLVYDLTNGLVYAGTDAGFLYAVSVPLP